MSSRRARWETNDDDDEACIVMNAVEKIASIRRAMPAEGLFADKDWRIAPVPFAIEPDLAAQLEKLGHRLLLFVRACNELYRRSVAGRQPAWIADYLDRGKPRELIELSRRNEFRDQIPAVIRPDLVLTDDGFTIAEIDNVPGGIGLTAWLNQTYAALGDEIVIGGADGMIRGFSAIAKGGDVLVSREAATYRPEMEWLAAAIAKRAAESGGQPPHVRDAESFVPASSPDNAATPRIVYRFFELFDLANIPAASSLIDAAIAQHIRVTPPFKAYLEEKLWFALFWLRPLREFWRREHGERHFLELQKHIPYTWILDPAPLPQHAVIPGLEINDWRELSQFSQKQRELILKISGFHETAWGSRGVVLGSDVSQSDWQAAVGHALAQFASHPHILQRFHKGRIVEQSFAREGSDTIETMRARVRLCPFYFVIDGKAELRGALATICPADKKLLHGMRDAVLAPTAVSKTADARLV
jgi:hypothetical protein